MRICVSHDCYVGSRHAVAIGVVNATLLSAMRGSLTKTHATGLRLFLAKPGHAA